MSRFAFGTYRVTCHNPEHIESLRFAFQEGIRVVDTSTNYMDGEAQRAIAIALKECEYDIEIISKIGYIQGSTMQKHKETPFEEVVEYSPDCFHSIAPSFIHNQIDESLERLERKSIEVMLLHNPEYYILDAMNRGVAKESYLDEMYRRIFEAFVALEEEVSSGRIGSYGISSNSFSRPSDAADFLPYSELLKLATNASIKAKNKSHSLSTIQLPLNILEQDGLACAKWAKERGVRVLVNRPLNASYKNQMFRLASYPFAQNYDGLLNEFISRAEELELQSLVNLLEQLDALKHRFSWIGDYEYFLYREIIPHVKRVLEPLERSAQLSLVEEFDLFIKEYREMVAYECSCKTKELLKEQIPSSSLSLEESALGFLMDCEYVDTILVGMRRPKYVAQILSLEK